MPLYNMAAINDPYATKALTDKLYKGEIDKDSYELGLNLAAGNPGGEETTRQVVSSYLEGVRSNPNLAMDANRRAIVNEYVRRGNMMNGTNYSLDEAINNSLSLNLQDRQQKMAEQQQNKLMRDGAGQYYGTQEDPETPQQDVFDAINEASKLEKAIAVYNERPEIFDLQHVRQLQALSEKHNIPFDPYPTPEHAVHLGVPGSATEDLEENWKNFFDGSSVGSMAQALVEGAVQGLTTIDIRSEESKLKDPVRADEVVRSIGSLAGFVGFGTGKSIPLLGSSMLSRQLGKTFPKIADWINPEMLERTLFNKKAMQVLENAAESGKLLTVAQRMTGGAFNLGVASGISAWQEGPSAMIDSMLGGAKAGAFFPLLRYMPGGNPAIKKTLGAIAGAAWEGIPAYREQGATPETLYNILLGGYFGHNEAAGEISASQAREKFAKQNQAEWEASGLADVLRNLSDTIAGKSREDAGETAYSPGKDGTYKDSHAVILIGDEGWESKVHDDLADRGTSLGEEGRSPVKFTSKTNALEILQKMEKTGKTRAYVGIINEIITEHKAKNAPIEYADIIGKLHDANVNVVGEFIDDFVDSVGDTNFGFAANSADSVGTIIINGSGHAYKNQEGAPKTLSQMLATLRFSPIESLKSAFVDNAESVKMIETSVGRMLGQKVEAIATGSSDTNLVFTDESGTYRFEGTQLKKIENLDVEIIPSKLRTLIIGQGPSVGLNSNAKKVIESIEAYGNITARIKRGGGTLDPGYTQYLNIQDRVDYMEIGEESRKTTIHTKEGSEDVFLSGPNAVSLSKTLEENLAEQGDKVVVRTDSTNNTVTVSGANIDAVASALSKITSSTPSAMGGLLERVKVNGLGGNAVTTTPSYEDILTSVNKDEGRADNVGAVTGISLVARPLIKGWSANSVSIEAPIITIRNGKIDITWATRHRGKNADGIHSALIRDRVGRFADAIIASLGEKGIKARTRDEYDTKTEFRSALDALSDNRVSHNKKKTIDIEGRDAKEIYEGVRNFVKDYILDIKAIGQHGENAEETLYSVGIGASVSPITASGSVYGASVSRAERTGAMSIAEAFGLTKVRTIYDGIDRRVVDFEAVRREGARFTIDSANRTDRTIADYIKEIIKGSSEPTAVRDVPMDAVGRFAIEAAFGGRHHSDTLISQLKFIAGDRYEGLVRGLAAEALGRIDKFFKSNSMSYNEGDVEYAGETRQLKKLIFGVSKKGVTLHSDPIFVERANATKTPDQVQIQLTRETARLFELGDIEIAEFARLKDAEKEGDNPIFDKIISTAELGNSKERAEALMAAISEADRNGLIYFMNDSVEGRLVFLRPNEAKINNEYDALRNSYVKRPALQRWLDYVVSNIAETEKDGLKIQKKDLLNYGISEDVTVLGATRSLDVARMRAKARVLSMVKVFGIKAALGGKGHTLGNARDFIKRATTLGPKNVAMSIGDLKIAEAELNFVDKLKEEKAAGRLTEEDEKYLEYVVEGDSRSTGAIALLREAHRPIWDSVKSTTSIDDRGLSVSVVPTLEINGKPLTDGKVWVNPRVLAMIHRVMGHYKEEGGIQKLVMKKLFGDTFFYGKLSFQVMDESAIWAWKQLNPGAERKIALPGGGTESKWRLPDIIFDDSALKSVKTGKLTYENVGGITKIRGLDYGRTDYLYFGNERGDFELGFSEHKVESKIPTQLFTFIYERGFNGDSATERRLSTANRAMLEGIKAEVKNMAERVTDREALLEDVKKLALEEPDLTSSITELLARGEDLHSPLMEKELNKYMLAKIFKKMFEMRLSKKDSGVSILSDGLMHGNDKIYDENGREIQYSRDVFDMPSGIEYANPIAIKKHTPAGKEYHAGEVKLGVGGLLLIKDGHALLPASMAKDGFKVGDKIIIDRVPIPKGSNITGLRVAGFLHEEYGNAIKVSPKVTFENLTGDLDIDKASIIKVDSSSPGMAKAFNAIFDLIDTDAWREASMSLSVDDLKAVDTISNSAEKWWDSKAIVLGTINASLGMDAVGKIASIHRFRAKVDATLKKGFQLGSGVRLVARGEFETVDGLQIELTKKAYDKYSTDPKWSSAVEERDGKYYIKELRLMDYYDLMLNIAVDDLKKGGVLSRKTYTDENGVEVDNPLYYKMADLRSRMFKLVGSDGKELIGEKHVAMRTVMAEALFRIESDNIRLEADLIRMKDPNTGKDYDLQTLKGRLAHYKKYHFDSHYRKKVISETVKDIIASQDGTIAREVNELLNVSLAKEDKFDILLGNEELADISGTALNNYIRDPSDSNLAYVHTEMNKIRETVEEAKNFAETIVASAGEAINKGMLIRVIDTYLMGGLKKEDLPGEISRTRRRYRGDSDPELQIDLENTTDVNDFVRSAKREHRNIIRMTLLAADKFKDSKTLRNLISYAINFNNARLDTLNTDAYIADSFLISGIKGKDAASRLSMIKLAGKMYDNPNARKGVYLSDGHVIGQLIKEVDKYYHTFEARRKIQNSYSDPEFWEYLDAQPNISNDALSSMVIEMADAVEKVAVFTASNINASHAAAKKAMAEYLNELSAKVGGKSKDKDKVVGNIRSARTLAYDIINLLSNYPRSTYYRKGVKDVEQFTMDLRKVIHTLSNKYGSVNGKRIAIRYEEAIGELSSLTHTSMDYLKKAVQTFVEYAAERTAYGDSLPVDDARAIFLDIAELASLERTSVVASFGTSTEIFDVYRDLFVDYAKKSGKLDGVAIYNKHLNKVFAERDAAKKGSVGKVEAPTPIISKNLNRTYNVDVAGRKISTIEGGKEVVLADFSKASGTADSAIKSLLESLNERADLVQELPGLIKGFANNPGFGWSSPEAREAGKSGLITRASDFRRIALVFEAASSSDPSKRYVAGMLLKGYALPRRVAESIARLSVAVQAPFLKEKVGAISKELVDPISMLSYASSEAELRLGRSSEGVAKEITFALHQLGNSLSDKSLYLKEEELVFKTVEGTGLTPEEAAELASNEALRTRINTAAGRVKNILRKHKEELIAHYNTGKIVLPDGVEIVGGLNGVIKYFNDTFGSNFSEVKISSESFREDYMPHIILDDKVLMKQLTEYVKSNNTALVASGDTERIQGMVNDMFNEYRGLGTELIAESGELKLSNSFRHMRKRSLNLEGFSRETGKVLLDYNKGFYQKINRDLLSVAATYIELSMKTGKGELGERLMPLIKKMEKDYPGATADVTKYLKTYGRNIVGVPSSDNATFFGLNINDKNVAARIEKYGKMWFGKDAFTKRGLTPERVLQLLSQHEGQFQVMALLAFPKSIITNLLGANKNIIKEIGFRKWLEVSSMVKKIRTTPGGSSDIEDILINYPEFDPSSPKGKSLIRQVRNILDTPGILASMTKYEAEITDMYGAVRVGKFKESILAGMSLSKALGNAGMSENVWNKLVRAGSWGMRVVEQSVRTKAFVAGLMQARDMKLPFEAGIRHGLRMVEKTQFFYNAASTPEFRNSALGRILTRFQPWAWQQWAFESDIIKEAKDLGFDPGTPEYRKFVRASSINAGLLAISAFLPFSMFGNMVPPPFSYAADLARSIFGDDEDEKSRAAMYNASRALSMATGPTLNNFLIGPSLALATENFSYNPYLLLPFGRAISGVVNTFKYPQFSPEIWTGVPVLSLKKAMESDEEPIKKKRTIAAIKRKPVLDEEEEKKDEE